ncbi:MAG: hypothetical protein ACOX3T_05655 [Bdellovibrionota bacterium]
MKEIFSALFEKYYEAICSFLQTFSANTWVLFGLIFIGLIVKLPLLLIIPLSYISYLSIENEATRNFILERTSIAPEFVMLGIWVVCISFKFFAFSKNNENGFSATIKNVLSFSLVFVLAISIGTPAFKASIFQEFQYVIIFGILLYALFNIFKHSIKLLKSGFLTFAWVFIITILGIQYNQEYFKDIFKEKDVKTFSELKYELNDSLSKKINKKINLNNTANVKSFIINKMQN